jgi:tight adherence protein C|uniref:Type II secretion system F family protein n=1 Tax=Desulfobacca acetoxidans TaxID=60893 RepID=A0A7V6A474_9BACT
MESSMLAILAATFGAVGLMTFGLLVYTSTRKEIQERFAKTKTDLAPMVRRRAKGANLLDQVLEIISSFGNMTLGKEKDKPRITDLRLTLIQAGFRYTNSVAVFYGIKAITTMAFPLCYLGYVMWTCKVTSMNLSIALGLAALGYYLPNYLLRRALNKRQDRIDKALPDVLDLMIVSMEAGLSLQATLNHVADEVLRISKDFCRELRITNAELRTGIPRDNALKNLGERTGVQSVKSLVALMIQSEKMGASIAQSLRTHADFVRVQRAQRAEELAAKLPIKIIFPTLFCIFPSIFIVILGPAALQIYHVLLKK